MDKNSLFLASLIILVGIMLAFLIKNQNHTQLPEKEYNLNIEENQSPEELPKEQNSNEESNIQVNSYTEALEKAKKENKKVLIFFSADWCTVCTKMKAETLSSTKVKEALNNFIFLEFNTDSEKELVEKYNVQSIPSYFLIDGNEKVLNNQEGYLNEAKFLNWLYKK